MSNELMSEDEITMVEKSNLFNLKFADAPANFRKLLKYVEMGTVLISTNRRQALSHKEQKHCRKIGIKGDKKHLQFIKNSI